MGNVLTIGIGAAPNDGTGLDLRDSMINIVGAVNGLAGSFNGPTPPTSLTPFQTWFDTSTTPPTLRYFDGTIWVGAATLDPSAHIWGSLSSPTGAVGGDLTGVLPNPTIGSLAVTNAKMAAGAAAANVGALGGDFSGSLPSPTIAKIQGVSVSGVTGTGNAVLSASPTITGTLTNQGLLSGSGGGGYATTAIDARNNNTNGIQITGTSTTQAQEITKSPLQVNWTPAFTGSPGGTFNTAAITAITTSTVNDQIYPWGIIGIVNNYTDVNTTGNPNAVAIAGTVFPKTVAGSQASSSWGGNFACDATGAAAVVNPTAYMLGAEIDDKFPTGSGTDNNFKRICLLVAPGTTGAVDTTIHVSAGIVINTNTTLDNGITFFPLNGASAFGTVGNIINVGLTAAHFTNFLNSPGFIVDNAGNTSVKKLSFNTVLTIAQLLALGSPALGQVTYVSDTTFSAAPTLHGTIAGSGSTTAAGIVSYNGSNWQWA